MHVVYKLQSIYKYLELTLKKFNVLYLSYVLLYNKLPKPQWLNITHFYYLIISEDQDFGHGLSGVLCSGLHSATVKMSVKF